MITLGTIPTDCPIEGCDQQLPTTVDVHLAGRGTVDHTGPTAVMNVDLTALRTHLQEQHAG